MIVALLTMLSVGSSTADPAADADLQASWAAFNKSASFPMPALDDKQRRDLLEGEVVKVVERHDDAPSRAIGLLVIDQPKEALWIASLDPHLTVDPDLTEARLDDGTTPQELWYGYIDLPMPLTDRHWVVDSWNNVALATATNNRAWEHGWRLSTQGLDAVRPAVAAGKVGGVTTAMMDAAIETPDNHGAWAFISLKDGRTVLIYHATSTIGGSVPNWLVFQLVMSRLDGLMRRVETRCDGLIHEHYASAHVPGGDNVGVPVAKLKR